jgi:hypothetical protein
MKSGADFDACRHLQNLHFASDRNAPFVRLPVPVGWRCAISGRYQPAISIRRIPGCIGQAARMQFPCKMTIFAQYEVIAGLAHVWKSTPYIYDAK